MSTIRLKCKNSGFLSGSPVFSFLYPLCSSVTERFRSEVTERSRSAERVKGFRVLSSKINNQHSAFLLRFRSRSRFRSRFRSCIFFLQSTVYSLIAYSRSRILSFFGILNLDFGIWIFLFLYSLSLLYFTVNCPLSTVNYFNFKNLINFITFN